MFHIWHMATVAPSLLAADFLRLADDLKSAEDAGVESLHLDIMDGHFVPNISFGPSIVKHVSTQTKLFLDVHLMLSNPEKYFSQFAEAGADAITYHLEVHEDPKPFVKELKKMGIQTGISINPNTGIEKVIKYLGYFDILLIMSVHPGFGGQKFIETALPKISKAREHIDKNDLPTRILVDGGVNVINADRIVNAGADVLVMGTAFFKAADRGEVVKKISKLEFNQNIPE